MRIGMLTQWYDPETGPAALPGVYAREFVGLGHEVSVLTGFPNYPTGRIYDGYKQRAREVSGDQKLKVTRVPLYASHSGSVVGRAANYATFAATAAFLGRPALRSSDVIWAYNSPATIAWPLLVHSGLGRKPVFLHVQDLWPDSLIHSGMVPGGWVGRSVESMIKPIIRLTERHSARIGVISPSVRELILERNHRIDPDAVVYAPNPTDEALFSRVDLGQRWADREAAGGVFEVVYLGAVGDVQGLDDVISAGKMLQSRRDIRFTLVGDGIARGRLERRVQDSGLSNIRFVGRIPQGEVPRWIQASDAQLVSLGSADFLRFTTPSKIGSLLASGIPVLGHLAGDGAAVISKANAGVVSFPGDARSLADAVERMAGAGRTTWQGWGDAGREYYERELSARVLASRMVETFEGLVARSNGGSR